jgi:hypothetical protein
LDAKTNAKKLLQYAALDTKVGLDLFDAMHPLAKQVNASLSPSGPTNIRVGDAVTLENHGEQGRLQTFATTTTLIVADAYRCHYRMHLGKQDISRLWVCKCIVCIGGRILALVDS